MQAELTRLHSPDVMDLVRYLPERENDFGFLLQAMIGPVNVQGEESFDIVVCTPEWLKRQHEGEILLGQHHLIVSKYDYGTIFNFIAKFAQRCIGEKWQDVAKQLSCLGRWEFENYRPEPDFVDSPAE